MQRKCSLSRRSLDPRRSGAHLISRIAEEVRDGARFQIAHALQDLWIGVCDVDTLDLLRECSTQRFDILSR
jgi:hypothetical protein